MAVVLGVDSSTQSTKVEARDVVTGEVRATGRASHPPTSPPVSEQDPDAWWTALVEAAAQLGSVADEVVAVSVGAQQHGLVVVGDDGRALRPAKLWNDTTSAPNADALVAALGTDRWAQGCGSVPVAAFTVAKLAWLAEHEPTLLNDVAKVMLPHDYLTWRLTGEHVTDRGDASGTGWFDPATDGYDAELLAAAGTGLDPAVLPRVCGPGDTVGTLTADAAAALGLPAVVVVGPGTGDNMAAALGLGLRAGDVALSLGTSGTVYAVADRPTADTSGHVAGFADANGGFLPLVCTLNATKVTDTVATWLGTDAAGLADLALAAPRSNGTGEGAEPRPTLVPYFDGERTPNLPGASGLFAGLRTTTTREALALAAHDGVLCGLLAGLDALRSAGVAADGRLVLIGGGARSAAYRARAADLHGRPVLIPDSDETVATGAAVQAAAVHGGASMDDVAAAWSLGEGITVEPQADDGPAVRAAYATAAAEVAAHHA